MDVVELQDANEIVDKPTTDFEALQAFPFSTKTINIRDLDIPFPRSGHRILATERYVYILGGFNPDLWNEDNSEGTSYPILRELWQFDIVTKQWSLIETKGHFPVEMASHTAVLHYNYILLFGGSGVPFGQASSNSLHALNLRDFTWKTLAIPGDETERPTKGYGQAAVIDNDVLYIVGGTDGFSYNCDVHYLDLKADFAKLKWAQLKGGRHSRNLARYRHECVCYDGKLILFGGGTATEVRGLAELDAYDLKAKTWITIKTYQDEEEGFPGARKCHGLGRYKDSVYICGGCNNESLIYDDVWQIDLHNFQWKKSTLKLQKPLYFHGFTISKNGCMYVFGGITRDDERSGDLYRYHLMPPTLKQICGEYIISRACKKEKSPLPLPWSDFTVCNFGVF